jgi:hypothetical protein
MHKRQMTEEESEEFREDRDRWSGEEKRGRTEE